MPLFIAQGAAAVKQMTETNRCHLIAALSVLGPDRCREALRGPVPYVSQLTEAVLATQH